MFSSINVTSTVHDGSLSETIVTTDGALMIRREIVPKMKSHTEQNVVDMVRLWKQVG